jgi:hypothetical protein
MKSHGFEEPSLVPLADMLANTVGIMVFILVFAVLTAGGAVVAKRFPLERSTGKDPLMFVCFNNRVLPLDSSGLINTLIKPLGQPSASDSRSWGLRLKAAQLVRNGYRITGDAEFLGDVLLARAAVRFEPLPGQGEDVTQLRAQGAVFRRNLLRHPSDKHFAYFLVFPDSIEAYGAARDVAGQAGYGTGWYPFGAHEKVSFSIYSLGGSGGGITPSEQ